MLHLTVDKVLRAWRMDPVAARFTHSQRESEATCFTVPAQGTGPAG